MRYSSFSLIFAACVALTGLFCSCSSSNDEWSPYTSRAAFDSDVATGDAARLTITTKGDPKYTLQAEIVSGSDFASFSEETSILRRTGIVGEPIAIYLKANDTAQRRYGNVLLRYSSGETFSLDFSQLEKSNDPKYDRVWAEQPAHRENDAFIYKTYYTTLSSGKRVRNYSVCFDKEKKVSQWVAYPLHSIYTSSRDYTTGGSTKGRTDAWAYDDAVTEYSSSSPHYKITGYNLTDPVIDQSCQQYIISTYGTEHARGHMLPSASRYSTWQTNAQTFYATNMMPQNYDFNAGSWAKVENGARNKQTCADTLYVVVGTLYEKATTIRDKKGSTITVPSHCYKLLLRTKNGNTGKSITQFTNASELKCIGFLFENSDNGNIDIQRAVVSVKEVEERSGFTFFHNLPKEIADQVKSQKNYSDWNF
ncbi:MAG: DNA/RNA non-specific endonuclease [Alistipes sp.]|nr:DNA/RNA non-specific endonuclease [Candidatus Alistipes equi]